MALRNSFFFFWQTTRVIQQLLDNCLCLYQNTFKVGQCSRLILSPPETNIF